MAQYDSSLTEYLSKYKYPDKARSDISSTLRQYRDLRPSLEPFVFNDGSQRQLVQLEGTIPVIYKGNTYNIPVSIWVLDTHPYNPPMAFVKPTSSMQIKPGRYVDSNGKVDMPFIREWNHASSDLLSLVQVLVLTFGEECPVFSRSGGAQRPQPQLSGYPAQTPYPSNPTGMPMPTPLSYPGTGGGGGPGYPPQGQGGFPPYPTPPAAGYPPRNTPPYPGYPPSTQSSGYPPYPASSSNPPPYPPSQTSGPPPYGNPGGYPPHSQFNTPTPYPPASAAVGSQNQNSQFTPGGTVTEEALKASLLSAVEDKMKRRLKETFAQAQAEMDVLSKTQKDLTDGKTRIEKIIADLDKEKDDIEKNMKLLKEKDEQVKEAIEKMEGNEEINIDEAVVTTTPLYKQLVDAFAEEQAIEDAIYYLGEALRNNVIELESFLKRVRELSRKQFMLRATIQKCREKAGLPPLV